MNSCQTDVLLGGGTRLTFTQSRVPEEHFEGIDQGWRDYYWEPIKDILEKYRLQDD